MDNKHRFRLLPLVIFASVFMFTIKVGEVWRSLASPEIGKNSLVKVGQVIAEEKTSEGQAEDKKTDNALENQTPNTSTTNNNNNNSKTETSPSSTETANKTQQEFKTTSPSVGEESLYSQSEIDVLQNLAERREILDAREQEITQQMAVIQAAEQQIDYKIVKLKELQTTIQELLKTYESKEKEKTESLVRIYSNMKPKDAARIFNDLEMPVLLQIFTQMKEAKSSTILSLMDSKKAHALTLELAKRKEIGATSQKSILQQF